LTIVKCEVEIWTVASRSVVVWRPASSEDHSTIISFSHFFVAVSQLILVARMSGL